MRLFRIKVLVIIGMMVWAACSAISPIDSDSKPISHEIWNSLLKKHVTVEGKVNYKGFIQDSIKLNQYLELMSGAHPNDKHWSKDEQMAYWINAYNAFTVRLIIRHYPLKSIKDLGGGVYKVNTTWDIKFIKIENEVYDLNNIEHSILRKQWSDPRVHTAVNCASYSCPRLRNEAFVAARLNDQLDDQMKYFVNNKTKNIITTEKAELSKIFSWFKGDFTANSTLIAFINKYSDVKINDKTAIEHLEYVWTLNE